MTTEAPVVKPATESQIRAEALMAELLNDSEIGSTIREKAKAKFADLKFPEDGVLKPVLEQFKSKTEALEAQLKEMSDKLAARDKDDTEKQTFAALQSKVENAVKEYSLTDDGKAKMLDRMKETGNLTDPDAAAAWVASKAPPTNVPGPTWAPQNMNLFGSQEKDEQFAALHKNPEKYMDDQLKEFVKNPEKYTAETFAA